MQIGVIGGKVVGGQLDQFQVLLVGFWNVVYQLVEQLCCWCEQQQECKLQVDVVLIYQDYCQYVLDCYIVEVGVMQYVLVQWFVQDCQFFYQQQQDGKCGYCVGYFYVQYELLWCCGWFDLFFVLVKQFDGCQVFGKQWCFEGQVGGDVVFVLFELYFFEIQFDVGDLYEYYYCLLCDVV